MPETYPDDNALLALTQDDATGVEYIPTGQSPYVTAYRRMLYRLLRAAERSNDLRVYDAGGLQAGVRGGRCFVGDQPRVVAATDPVGLSPDSTTHVYIDAAGSIQASTSGLPADRSTYIPLAEVVTDAQGVTALTDLRGEAMLQAQTAALAGISATADEINQALDGVSAGVTAAHLSALTGGAFSSADSLHRHLATNQDVDGLAEVAFDNLSSDPAANIAISLGLPSVLPDVTKLQVDRGTGYFQQVHMGTAHHLVGAVPLQRRHAGALSASIAGELVGAVPIAGEVVAVVLSCASNTQSSDSADGVSLSGSSSRVMAMALNAPGKKRPSESVNVRTPFPNPSMVKLPAFNSASVSVFTNQTTYSTPAVVNGRP